MTNQRRGLLPDNKEAAMAVNKKHDEFYTLDMSAGWETPAGYPAGI